MNPSCSRVPSLRINMLANFLGRGSSMLFAILFTPLYIHFLGMESYGLIGFYLTMQGAISFLEMGLSRACNRELARHSGLGDSAHHQMLSTLRTLEGIYWFVALLLGLAFTLAAPWISRDWLSSSILTDTELERVLYIMGWVIALRWPVGVYNGALMGLQKHVHMNLAQVFISLLSGGGAVLVLWLVRSDITLYFQWQMISALCGVLVVSVLAWKSMPGSPFSARFSRSVLKNVYQFAAGVGLNAVMGTILRQGDRIIVSAMLPLTQFGYYILASVIANAVSGLMADPISSAVFPRFSQMLAQGMGRDAISRLYHLASQLISVLSISFALVIAFFAEQVLFVYTGSYEVSAGSATILAVLVIAKMFHASVSIPYTLQMAKGWLRLSLWMNLVSMLWLLPAVYWGTERYGPVGASASWLVVTIGYVVIGMPLMHRYILRGELWRWMWSALISPIGMVSIFLVVSKWMLGTQFSDDRILLGLLLVFMVVASGILALLSARDLRGWCNGRARQWRVV